MLALSLLVARDRRRALARPVLDDWADRVMRRRRGRRGGGFQHDVSDKVNAGELWDDTLFMVALFLASYGQGLRPPRRSSTRPCGSSWSTPTTSRTARPASGSTAGPSPAGTTSPAPAGRAATPGSPPASSTCLELAEIDAGARAFLTSVLTAQVEALLPLQTDDGAWRTLLDDPASYEETAATAGFAYGS